MREVEWTLGVHVGPQRTAPQTLACVGAVESLRSAST